MIEVILARHAESEANARGIVNGNPSIAYRLTRAGRTQAKGLGRQLAGQHIDVCVVTEFARTRETADIALEGRDIPRLVIAELNDPVAGFLEGRALSETRRWFLAHGPKARPDGGESRTETIARYCRGFRLVLGRPEASVLVVAHGLPVVALRLAAEGGELPMTLSRFPPDHASPFRMSAEELERGLAVMGQWVRNMEAA